MEISEDESSRTIDPSSGIAVRRYRLTETDCTLPLYSIHTALLICNNLIHNNGRHYQ